MKKKTSPSRNRGARLGQHLLTSTAIARAVAEAAHIREGDTVLEIGPGGGILTHELLALGARVVAIEKDPAFVQSLTEQFSKEVASAKLSIVEGDFRDIFTLKAKSLNLGAPYKVAANIPYYITGEIIRLLLTAPHQPTTISLLIQKEVAERIVRSKKESLLSLSVKAYGTPEYVRTVKAGSFNPPPSVDSAILAINEISRTHFEGISEKRFFELLHIGFGQKRKTLAGNLTRAGLSAETVKNALTSLNLSLTVRAEDVPLQQWLHISELL